MIADNELPPVSIVVIGYNEAKNLRSTFEAIRKINYDKLKIELLYVDSGSSDNSIEIASHYTDKIFIENIYPTSGRNRNRGLIEAHSEIIHFIDGDVTIHEDYLRNIVCLFKEKKVQAIVGQLDEQNPNLFNQMAALANVDKKEGYTLFTSTGATYLKSALISINGYDERIKRGQETELGERFRKSGFKIWCTNYKMGSHNFGIKSVRQFFEKEKLQGKSTSQVALMKGSGDFFSQSRKVLRNQIIKLGLLIIFTIISIWLMEVFYLLSYLFVSFIYQYRSLIMKANKLNFKLVTLSLFLKFFSQFYFLFGMIKELLCFISNKRTGAKFYQLEKEQIYNM